MQASLSPQTDLAPTEMFDIDDHQGSDVSASLKAGLPISGSELHLCLQTGPTRAVGGLPVTLPCLLHTPVSLLLAMLAAGFRALVIKSANLPRASIN